MLKPHFWISYGFLLAILLITGCSAPLAPPFPGLATSIFSSQNSMTQAFTPSKLPQRATLTLMVLTTPIPTLQPLTDTPRPTLSVEEAKVLILELVQKHEGCRLPCLWGMTPGQTELETARAFVAQFGDIRTTDIEVDSNDYGDAGGAGMSYKKNNAFVIVDLSYYKSKETSQLELLAMYSFSLEDLGPNALTQGPSLAPIWGDPTFKQELQEYLLPSILATYGPPPQVMLTVRPDEPDRPDIKWHPFSLALLYPEQGIFVEYVSPREIVGNNFVGCPNDAHISLATWAPESKLPLEYIVEKAGSEILVDYFKPIDEATSMTLDEFYETFKDPENTACLETPTDLWSQP